MEITTFILLGIATYRLSFLLADEDGPWEIIERFRYFIGVRYDDTSMRYGTNVFANGIICSFCNSVWIGIGLTVLWFLSPEILFIVALPFALSGFAVFMGRH